MMETKFTKEEYEELEKRAEDIIKNATKDICMWNAILEQTKKNLEDA